MSQLKLRPPRGIIGPVGLPSGRNPRAQTGVPVPQPQGLTPTERIVYAGTEVPTS
jgi:hypothetical protein